MDALTTGTLTARLDRPALGRLAAAARELHHNGAEAEARLLRAVDNLRRSGRVSQDDWWQARLAVVAGVGRR